MARLNNHNEDSKMSYNDFQYDFDDRYNFSRSKNDDHDRYTFGRSNDHDAYEQSDKDDDRDDRSDDIAHYLNAYAPSDYADDGRYDYERSDHHDDNDAYGQSDNDDHDRYEYGAQFQHISSDTEYNQGAVLQLQVEREEKIFSFDVSGNVVSMGEIRANGTIKAERIDQDESYALYGDFVIKTETEGFGKTEFTAYADGDGDGRWAEVAEGYGQMSIASFVQMIPANYSNFG